MTRTLALWTAACGLAAALAVGATDPRHPERAGAVAPPGRGLASLLVSPPRADEDNALTFGYDFPPPPGTAPAAGEPPAPPPAVVAAALHEVPAAPEAPEPTQAAIAAVREAVGAAPRPGGEEAMAEAALRTAAAFAAPVWSQQRRKRVGLARQVRKDIDAELRCLALNVYWEARSEPALGRLAVAAVTLNRVKHRSFPATVCEVGAQGEELGPNRCQFSWVCDGKSNVPDHATAWREAEHVAYSALFLDLPDPTAGALWYHADYVSPPWAKAMARITQIGRHLFYRGPLRTAEGDRGIAG